MVQYFGNDFSKCYNTFSYHLYDCIHYNVIKDRGKKTICTNVNLNTFAWLWWSMTCVFLPPLTLRSRRISVKYSKARKLDPFILQYSVHFPPVRRMCWSSNKTPCNLDPNHHTTILTFMPTLTLWQLTGPECCTGSPDHWWWTGFLVFHKPQPCPKESLVGSILYFIGFLLNCYACSQTIIQKNTRITGSKDSLIL